MFSSKHSRIHGFLTAAPVNAALVMGVVAFPDFAWEIILGTGTFMLTLVGLSLPPFSRLR